jgi:hypothetical protein|tara:strand:+ start:376 stop:660 length:285 start_codon:yes stop_codon:yes gene_type:complete
MLKQQKIKINEVGKKHNMTSQDSLKAYYKICEFIAETISSTPRNDNGTYEPESFKTIGLPGFGKLYPNKLKVIQINKALVASKARANKKKKDEV